MKPEARIRQLTLRVRTLMHQINKFYEDFMINEFEGAPLFKLEQLHNDIIKFINGWVEYELLGEDEKWDKLKILDK